jgi:hypothetical protein
MRQRLVDFLNVLQGFRKFIAWFGLFVVGIIFRLNNYIDGPDWVDLMKATFAGFVAGNGIEYVAGTVKDHLANRRAMIQQAVINSTPPVTPTASPLDNP